ncbi:MbcA/ParS/Xre antitoxin family protein [Legionella londiniensis]|uniref:Antitoxin Xre/MbcA/ParS-like toxin-binding domain-containing protein n=1 Tax=Legionella londiniensis TaxID=45068 RepID=A0A0W0VQF8_9GAMM|nr:MbcA/ParS/Xre antitoxin family protein [Legionella londiniensis]KTD22391.1 hypothetical protein Llon_0609 [Legionella londiniensis]STX93035.1 Uncharacterised protein [Legionella londiniensis]
MQLATANSLKISDAIAWKSLKQLVYKFSFKPREAMILMGDIPKATYYAGIGHYQGKLNRDQLERISYLLGIYKALVILFDDRQQAMSWIIRNNSLPPFYGKTPKEFMLEGSIVRLSEVRRFLDFWRGY